MAHFQRLQSQGLKRNKMKNKKRDLTIVKNFLKTGRLLN